MILWVRSSQDFSFHLLLWLLETGNKSGKVSNQPGWQHVANKTLLSTSQFQTRALPSLSWSIYSKSSQDPVIHYVRTELILHLLGCKALPSFHSLAEREAFLKRERTFWSTEKKPQWWWQWRNKYTSLLEGKWSFQSTGMAESGVRNRVTEQYKGSTLILICGTWGNFWKVSRSRN